MATASSWVRVPDGLRTYYHNPETGEVSWIKPRESFQAPQATSLKKSGSLPGDGEEERKEEMEEKDPQDAISAKSWLVQIHPDCGQILYRNPADNTSSWTDPFASADFEALLDTLEEDGSRRRGDEDQQEKIEDLAGFNLSPDRGVFKSEEAEWARSRLSEWIQDQSIEVGRLNAHLTGARLPYLMEMCLAGDRGRRGVSQMGGVHQRHRNL